MREPSRHPVKQEPHASGLPGACDASLLSTLLDQLLIGVMLTDATARLCYANRRAQELLAEHDSLVLGPAGLVAATESATRRLRHALALTAAPQPDSLMPARYLALPRRSAQGRALLLRLSPLPGTAPLAAIFITPPEHLPPVPREAITEAFGLTPREAALAGLLAEGHELRDCARLLLIGEGTARNHLKHVFEKTVKHSQSALVAELCRIAGPCR
jgi:DNA-binding CsgD family transcriptional regulator